MSMSCASPYQILVSIRGPHRHCTECFAPCWTNCAKLTCCSAWKRTAQRPGRFDETEGVFHPFTDDELRKRIIPDHMKRIMALQKNHGRNYKNCRSFRDADAAIIRSVTEQEGVPESE